MLCLQFNVYLQIQWKIGKKIAHKKTVIDSQSTHQPKDDESSFTLKNVGLDKTLNKFALMNILLDKKSLMSEPQFKMIASLTKLLIQ